MSSLRFPDGFLWGSATAAHQVEGGNWANDWWAWEHQAGTPCAEPSGDCCDHYHRYEEDFALLEALGHNSHRLSIEWSRIEPAEGEWAYAEIEHYKRVFSSAAEHGLRLLVTLHHFTSPHWFTAKGGWAEQSNVQYFERFCEMVARHLGDLIPIALTINEPQVVALMGYGLQVFPPGRGDRDSRHLATRNFIAAHAAGARALRSGKGKPDVGIVLAINDIVAAAPEAEARRETIFHHMGGVYLDAIETGWVRGLRVPDEEIPGLAGSCDLVGLNWYTRNFVEADGTMRSFPAHETERTSQMGWEEIPDGLTASLRTVGRLGLPVIITENGIGTSDDERRISYIRDHLAAAHASLPDVDLRGYMHWSTMDNFEWAYGYRMTFGLIAVDRADGFRRIPKPSAEYYGEIARSNCVDI